jgi:hypothetical protein
LFEADSPFDNLKVLAVPVRYIASAITRTNLTSLAQLSSAHEIAPDLVNSRYVQSGTIGTRSDANGNPVGQAFAFRPSTKELQLFISWNAAEHFNGKAVVKVYDESNRVLFETKAQSAQTSGGGHWVVHAGTIPLDSFPPGTYRVDYVLNDGPAWRSFFRMIP